MQKSVLHNNLHWKCKIYGVLLTPVVIFVPVQKIFSLCFLVLLISVNDQCWNVLLSEVLPITWRFSNIVFKQDLNVKWLYRVLHDNRLTSVIVNSSIHSDTTLTFLCKLNVYSWLKPLLISYFLSNIFVNFVKLPYVGYIGMRHPKGCGFQTVYSRAGYKNQRVWVYNRVSFSWKLINWFSSRLGP